MSLFQILLGGMANSIDQLDQTVPKGASSIHGDTLFEALLLFVHKNDVMV